MTDEAIYKIELPGTAEEVYAMAIALYDQKRFQEAVVLCEQAEAEGKQNAQIFAVHSASLIRTRRPQDAIDLLQPRMQDYPDEAKLHFNLGSAYNGTFNRSEAKKEIAIARSLDPYVIGKSVRKATAIRVGVTAGFACILVVGALFWPHTRWLLEVFFAVLIALTGLTVVMSFKASPRRSIPLAAILLVWVLMLLLVIFAPAHLW
jgi:tetratricopeptide (TPR) repeat protein